MGAKRFHLFCGQDHYPGHGLGDYVGSYATFEDAVQADRPMYDWWEIIESESDGLVVVAQGRIRR